MHELHHIRREYQLKELSKASVNADPFLQFSEWLKEAFDAKVQDPTAMVLSTVSNKGRPSSRVVLLKQVTNNGFDFFTNYLSKKGQQLKNKPFASLLFFWPELERQVRIEGKIALLPMKESDGYFLSRPLQSQIGAWASPQSSIIEDRNVLENRVKEFDEKFKVEAISRPPHWGGYRLEPDLFEFWQGRKSRLHDRIEYLKSSEGWEHHRLAP
jgi:pyridoxamine-phosphate oxidase